MKMEEWKPILFFSAYKGRVGCHWRNLEILIRLPLVTSILSLKVIPQKIVAKTKLDFLGLQ